MVKRAALIAALLAALASAACGAGARDDLDRRLAESFLRSAPTFRYDGIADSVEFRGAADADCEGCRAFTFAFKSAKRGYGDRSPLNLKADVTPHESTIVVQDGLVVAGEVDGVWDVLGQAPMAPSAARANLSPNRVASPDPVAVSLDAPFELLIGQEAVFDSEILRITFLDVSEDSRCPASTVCDSLGRARARLELVEGDRSLGVHEFVIGQAAVGQPVGIGRWALSLRALNAEDSGDAWRYAAILVVSKTLAA